jgi:hypothetical protein
VKRIENKALFKKKRKRKTSSSTYVAASLPLIHGCRPALPTKVQPFLVIPIHCSRF